MCALKVPSPSFNIWSRSIMGSKRSNNFDSGMWFGQHVLRCQRFHQTFPISTYIRNGSLDHSAIIQLNTIIELFEALHNLSKSKTGIYNWWCPEQGNGFETNWDVHLLDEEIKTNVLTAFATPQKLLLQLWVSSFTPDQVSIHNRWRCLISRPSHRIQDWCPGSPGNHCILGAEGTSYG